MSDAAPLITLTGATRRFRQGDAHEGDQRGKDARRGPEQEVRSVHGLEPLGPSIG